MPKQTIMNKEGKIYGTLGLGLQISLITLFYYYYFVTNWHLLNKKEITGQT